MSDSRTGRRWLPAPFTAAGLVVLAACGGGDSTAPTDAPATAPETTASADAFADCMTAQGVPAPEGGTRITGPRQGEPGQRQDAPVTRRNPPPAPDGVDPEKWEAALEACGPPGVRRTAAPGGGA
ncbi:hypothetical protein [Pseudonocardia adelaidensis]|uniref:Uncharacterized protein n=1 Tax=Pseudonocardia adelaidensis TaxID=648754 RepID=A0ABP9NQF2_9PSEU